MANTACYSIRGTIDRRECELICRVLRHIWSLAQPVNLNYILVELVHFVQGLAKYFCSGMTLRNALINSRDIRHKELKLVIARVITFNRI